MEGKLKRRRRPKIPHTQQTVSGLVALVEGAIEMLARRLSFWACTQTKGHIYLPDGTNRSKKGCVKPKSCPCSCLALLPRCWAVAQYSCPSRVRSRNVLAVIIVVVVGSNPDGGLLHARCPLGAKRIFTWSGGTKQASCLDVLITGNKMRELPLYTLTWTEGSQLSKHGREDAGILRRAVSAYASPATRLLAGSIPGPRVLVSDTAGNKGTHEGRKERGQEDVEEYGIPSQGPASYLRFSQPPETSSSVRPMFLAPFPNQTPTQVASLDIARSPPYRRHSLQSIGPG